MKLTRPSAVAAFFAVVLTVFAVVGVAPSTTGAATESATAPTWPVSHQGRWLTDADGRALLVHGVNFVAKGVGVTPADMGFGEDDAQWLVDNGFEVVRLGTTAASIMPTPGVIDTAYVDSFAQTVRMLTDHGLLVLVDLHQDGWGPTLGNDGFPEWMTLTHGATNTHTEFPLYYVTNPAIQAAFQSFWDNEEGPDGVPLQDHAAEIWKALAGAVTPNPGVIGYDLLNEPWTGVDNWQACVTPAGCPTQEAALDAFHTRMTQAIRTVDPTTLIFGEPFVLFNFGQGPTHVSRPGNDPASGLAWHLYTLDAASEPVAIDYAAQWAEQTGGALLNTEFGAVSDPPSINRMTGELDRALMPWIWWAYNEQILPDAHNAPTEENLPKPDAVDAIVRPHPVAVAGTPKALDYDPSMRRLDFSYTPQRVGGGTFAADTVTSFALPDRNYPDGYRVDVIGGRVTSEPGAAQLSVVTDPGASCVSVAVVPAGAAAPAADADGCTTTTPPTTVAPTPTKPAPKPSQVTPAVAVRAEPTFTG